jgi:hypothetical protein
MKLSVAIDQRNKKALLNGRVFGSVYFGSVFLNNLSLRISIKVNGKDGKKYYGTFFHSKGKIATIKPYERR